ncbi:MAG: hypothetical protein ABIG87_01535 [Patescibacteria group bacterium]
MKKICASFLVFIFMFVGVIAVSADEVVEPVLLDEEDGATNMEVEKVDLIDTESENIVEVAEQVQTNPSNFGLWWRGVRENIGLVFAFSTQKKAEKALIYANERMELADVFAQNAQTTEEQEKAQKMMDKANSFIEKVEVQKQKVDEETQAHLMEVKTRIIQHREEIKLYNTQKMELINRVKAGDEDAKAELQSLNKGKADGLETAKKEMRVDAEKRVEKEEQTRKDLEAKLNEDNEQDGIEAEKTERIENTVQERKEEGNGGNTQSIRQEEMNKIREEGTGELQENESSEKINIKDTIKNGVVKVKKIFNNNQ